MSERKVCECAAQIAAMREAAELALDTVGNGGNVDVANALRDALSGDTGRALLERVEALERVVAEVRRMEASFLMVQPDLVQAMVALDALKEKR